jgi:AmmeMemoRadiSam system protein B/AmmeMemoRadiSam system protein A
MMVRQDNHNSHNKQFKKLIIATIVLQLVAIFMTADAGYAQIGIEGKRRLQFAGSWYEADPERLSSELDTFLAKADPLVDQKTVSLICESDSPITQPVSAIVAPHAGFAYSGQAAAYAYKCARRPNVKRVFLLGPSHYVGFRGAALPQAVTFATPFGDLDVDKQVVSELRHYSLFSKMPDVHRMEHSLEMQLPYIYKVFGEVKIVPIVIGQLSDDTEAFMLGAILKRYIDKDDLVIVSSDFTHYGPRYDYQPFKDNIKQNVRNLDKQALACLCKLDAHAFMDFQKETKDTICGFYPLAVLLSMLPKQSHCTLLKYYTSQDTTLSDKDNSVSYMAIAFSGKPWVQASAPAAEGKLTAQEKQDLLKLARRTLEMYVQEKKAPTPQELGITVTPNMTKLMGAFVTLYKKPTGDALKTGHDERSSEKELRGCIGYIWPFKPLYQAVIDNTVSACSTDYRFYSVKPEELKDIFIDINVLTPPHRITGYESLVLGRDGIVLYKEGAQSVFLPSVPIDFGWDLSTTLSQLSKKAGLEPDAWKEGARFDAFQSDSFEEKH